MPCIVRHRIQRRVCRSTLGGIVVSSCEWEGLVRRYDAGGQLAGLAQEPGIH